LATISIEYGGNGRHTGALVRGENGGAGRQVLMEGHRREECQGEQNGHLNTLPQAGNQCRATVITPASWV